MKETIWNPSGFLNNKSDYCFYQKKKKKRWPKMYELIALI
jgi:hypothetical protein